MNLGKSIAACGAAKYLWVAIGMIGLHANWAPRAEAAIMVFGSNDYEFVQVTNPFSGTNNTWATAKAAAAASVFNGVNGHLATVTSLAENDFLFSLVPSDPSFSGFEGAWLGGKSTEGWLVGPEAAGQGFSYTNWGGSEPNNSGYAYMNIGATYAGIDPGKWADDSLTQGQGVPDSHDDPVIGYFIEYEGTATVPEPASWQLFASGLVGLAVFMRKRLFRNG